MYRIELYKKDHHQMGVLSLLNVCYNSKIKVDAIDEKL